MLPNVTKCYQKLPNVTNSYQMLPKVTNCCQKFLYLWTPMNHYHNRLQGGHFVPGQYVSWDNMSPSCTGTICLLGQYVPFLNSKIMSNRGTFCPGDVLSRDNICPGTICPGTKCPQTISFWFFAKVCFAHCSTSRLALGSPGCLFVVVTMPRIPYKTL